MKAIRSLLFLGLMSGLSQAATINVSAGLPTGQQGFSVFNGGVLVTSYFTAVGNFNAGTGTFTPFVTLADTGEVSGSFVATGPSSFNGTIIDVFVGLGNSIEASGNNWMVVRSTANTAFPADVGGTTAVTFAFSVPSGLTIVGSGNPGHNLALGNTGGVANSNSLNFVPEPSAALLGVLGVFGLMRRRR